MRRWLLAVVLVAVALQARSQGLPQERVLDDFADPAAWTISTTDDVAASLRVMPAVPAASTASAAPAASAASSRRAGPATPALCIDFDFGHVTGYIAARRVLPIDFPARYELALSVRGDAPRNDLQLKLVDASGENVWWARKPDFQFPADRRTLKFRQRDIEFAWGPTSDRLLRRTTAVEIVIASGTGAGKGRACFDRLSLRELPVDVPVPPVPVAVASSALARHPAANAIDGNAASDWQPAATAASTGATLTIDYGQPREFSLLSLRWREGAAASRYAISLSDDGAHWRLARQVTRARGTLQSHWLPDTEMRFLRLAIDQGAGPPVALAEVELGDVPTANAYFARLASEAVRGRYPRAYVGEQSYWTVFGIDGGRVASLLGEDGAVEPVPGVGALEPFLAVDGRVLGWADARITHTLREGDLPMPSVHWQAADLTLDVDAFGIGSPDSAQAAARYTVRNLGTRAHDVTLALAWRPFQVNPPTQFLAHPGGASDTGHIEWDGHVLHVDGVARLQPLTPPDSVRVEALATGPVGDWLGESAAADDPTDRVDPAGFASGVLRYTLRLLPGQRREFMVAMPVTGSAPAPSIAEFRRAESAVAAHWRERADRVRITGPGEVADIARTVRSALGHILVNRNGRALQPGARAYARSWIRDGALTSSALLRLGQDDVAGDFVQWYAPFQFSNGKIPCCATSRGADPVPENDSDGEFIFAATELWRYTHDDVTARALWPNVRAAVGHMESLRQSERSEANRSDADPARRAYFGLMPRSISHEGYSDRPAYSYWDDFWAATGYRSAADLAGGLGLPDDRHRIADEGREFLADVRASIEASTSSHGLDVLPGAADRGDFDPTSSTIALSPGGLVDVLPEPLLRNTFERYWRNFVERRDSGKPWDAYTPYEWRNVGALVRLGQRERALEAMAYFYRDRRPAGWNQWAEVVGRLPREPRFIGDMPHGWVASDQIRSVLDLFAYEGEEDRSLVLAAGVPMAWFDGPGLTLQRLRTPFGELSWRARRERVRGGVSGVGGVGGVGGGSADMKGHRGVVIDFDLAPLRRMPEGGIEVRGPWPAASRVWLDGRRVPGSATRITVPRTPAHLRVELPASARDRTKSRMP